MLDKLVAFHHGINMLVDKGRATYIIYLDLCKAVGAVTQNIPVSKLERHGLIKNWQAGDTEELLSMAQCPSDKWHSSGLGLATSTVSHLCW